MRLIIFSLITAALIGCSNPKQEIKNETIKVTENSFNITIELKANHLESISDSLFVPNTLRIVDDYLFISENTSNHVMHIIKLPEDQYIGTRGLRGAGPGEILSPWKLISPESNIIGVFDTELGKIVLYNIDTLLQKNKYTSEYLDKNLIYSSAATIEEEKIFYLGNANKTDARFYSRNLKDNTDPIRTYGKLPELTESYPNLNRDEEQEILSFANLISKEKIILISYYKSPLVEIYDLSDESKILLSGPDEFPSPELFGDIRYYYSSYISEKYIYLLYVENKKEHSTSSQTIFVLSHKGNPVKKFKLDRPISQLAIHKDQTLYGLEYGDDSTNYSLFKFDID